MKKITLIGRTDLSFARKKFMKNLHKTIGEEYQLEWIGKKDIGELRDRINQKRYLRSDLYAEGERKITPLLRRIPSHFLSLYKYTKENSADCLFVAADTLSEGPLTTLVGKMKNIPTIVRVPEDPYSYLEDRSPFNPKLPELYLNYIFKADKLITLGPYMKEKLVKRGCREDKITILPQPTNEEKFNPPEDKEEKREIRKELDLPQDKEIVLSVGRLTRDKGMDTLERVIPKVLEEKEDIVFLIIGEGPYKEKLDKLSERVITPGNIPFSQIDKYYKAADLYLHPSYLEALPNVMLEAAASGLPTIGREDVGEVEWIADHTFKTEKQLTQLLTEKTWKPNYSNNLKEELKWENLKPKYIKTFKETIGE